MPLAKGEVLQGGELRERMIKLTRHPHMAATEAIGALADAFDEWAADTFGVHQVDRLRGRTPSTSDLAHMFTMAVIAAEPVLSRGVKPKERTRPIQDQWAGVIEKVASAAGYLRVAAIGLVGGDFDLALSCAVTLIEDARKIEATCPDLPGFRVMKYTSGEMT